MERAVAVTITVTASKKETAEHAVQLFDGKINNTGKYWLEDS